MDKIISAAVGPLATYILSTIAALLIGAYIAFRAKSTILIREKALRFFVGDADFQDEAIQEVSCERRDLARFRILHRIPAPTLNDLRRLLAWMTAHGLRLDELSLTPNWIDYKNESFLVTPKKRWFMCLTLGFLFFWLNVVSFLVISQSNNALLTMKASGVMFLSNGSEATSLFGRWRYDKAACAAGRIPETRRTGLTDSESSALCTGLAEGLLMRPVEEGLSIQRPAAWALVILCAVWGCQVLAALGEAIRALMLSKKVRAHGALVQNASGRLQEDGVPPDANASEPSAIEPTGELIR
ncbi:DUF6216 family protein [Caballeronia cordobensis]|uniref:DUF6216 family protein n=1 Tax=Caballeronia cordobensis TaxID=1353886 RepID=UPI0006AD6BF7